MENISITKSNVLVNAGYRLTLTEMQIVLYGVSLINPLAKDFPLTYEIKVSEFAKMFNREHCQIYSEIKDSVIRRFWERDFSYVSESGKIKLSRWLTDVCYDDSSGFMEITFNRTLKKYLHQLQGHFTKYYITQVSDFKSVYSVRFYELLLMKLNQDKSSTSSFSIEISALKERLNLGDKYSRFCNFKERVLEKAKAEINKFSDINITYTVKKKGHSPHSIEFKTIKKTVKTTSNSSITIEVDLSPAIIEKAKYMALNAGTGWDIQEIKKQFFAYKKSKGKTKDIDAAFIGFTKKKVLLQA